MTAWQRIIVLLGFLAIVLGTRYARELRRRTCFQRGRRLLTRQPRGSSNGYRWGSLTISRSAATQHFLAVGTTGSGKSLVQRLLMKDVFADFGPGNDARALIFDVKNDVVPLLHQFQLSVPIYSLHPFESRRTFPQAVAWDIATDITSPARALNLAACLLPTEKNSGNQYFTDAARQVVAAVVESLIRHSPGIWTFSQFIYAVLSQERIRQILCRDAEGQETLENFFGDDRTGYQVFTTIASRMSYFRPVAALWQRTDAKLSLRHWLTTDSVLLFGMDATARIALDAINEIMFRVVVEEIDIQTDSQTRRTWVWIDEARLAGPILQGDLLPYLAVKGRSKGACLVLAFQDIEGFREAAGPRIANEIIAQCSHKALLRMEAEESATWASRLLGQYESIEVMRTQSTRIGQAGSRSEQLSKRETVLPSEFYLIPPTDKRAGLTGYFVAPKTGAVHSVISGSKLQPVFIADDVAKRYRFMRRNESEQRLIPWTPSEMERLGIKPVPVVTKPLRSPALKLKKQQSSGRCSRAFD